MYVQGASTFPGTVSVNKGIALVFLMFFAMFANPLLRGVAEERAVSVALRVRGSIFDAVYRLVSTL